ncbi:MFS transporter [Mucisphaera calidilacus]|uniref:Major Facilitator Superfamily protein n=1 Tax=Mucisphaera calidilacus TaxID=2527982 RepID=A0A518C1A8_9BACT|nr:MFS transporter [Mucisphaera calidilacus]QDU73000.1 Major Facilitator Superfamily protein [Mucisphaera calidilacus]
MLEYIAGFRPSAQPLMTRPTYERELWTAMAMPIAVSMVEGGVVGILAKKAFDVSPIVFAAIQAAPMFANVTSLGWAMLARGRPKVPFITGMMVVVLLCVAGIALLPTGGVLGSWLLALLVIASRCLLAGVVTLRSVVWRNNYPRHVRAQITGRLSLVVSLVVAVAPVVGYGFLDRGPENFRILYPVAALLAVVGVVSFSRVRLRQEASLLAYENRSDVEPVPKGETGAVYEYEALPRDTFWSVLRKDGAFRTYMFWQFIAGMSMMSGETVVVYVIAEQTAGWSYEYLLSVLLSTSVPMLVAVALMPTWARYLDRVHIAKFRTRQGWFWALAQGLNLMGALLGSLSLIGLARAVIGMVRAGGMLAWNLGHNDFADRRLVSIYMGIHVTLTGVRGAIAPFLGILLYAGWSERDLGGGVVLPGFEGLGSWFFAVSLGLAVLAWAGFARMAREAESVAGS